MKAAVNVTLVILEWLRPYNWYYESRSVLHNIYPFDTQSPFNFTISGSRSLGVGVLEQDRRYIYDRLVLYEHRIIRLLLNPYKRKNLLFSSECVVFHVFNHATMAPVHDSTWITRSYSVLCTVEKTTVISECY